jgi:hypothetical protein
MAVAHTLRGGGSLASPTAFGDTRLMNSTTVENANALSFSGKDIVFVA